MGLLDDAIREHLDLKRRHGADEDELQRQEAEALGPARREPVLDESGPPEPAAAETAPPLEPAMASELEAAPEELAPEPAPAPPEPDAIPEQPEPSEVPEAEALEPPAAGDTSPRGFPAVTEEEPIEREPASEEEDVLEETPDFLQETPEHDRLWFEQKPPRDFDFD